MVRGAISPLPVKETLTMINPDFRDLFAAFVASDVRFVVVGGYAVGYHGHPRYTKDVDILVDPSGDNPKRVLDALGEFGTPVGAVSAGDFADPENVFQVGIAPNRVDILCGLTGIGFDEVWAGKVTSDYGGVPIHYIGLRQLIQAKRAAGRPQDLLDVEELERRNAPDP